MHISLPPFNFYSSYWVPIPRGLFGNIFAMEPAKRMPCLFCPVGGTDRLHITIVAIVTDKVHRSEMVNCVFVMDAVATFLLVDDEIAVSVVAVNCDIFLCQFLGFKCLEATDGNLCTWESCVDCIIAFIPYFMSEWF